MRATKRKADYDTYLQNLSGKAKKRMSDLAKMRIPRLLGWLVKHDIETMTALGTLDEIIEDDTIEDIDPVKVEAMKVVCELAEDRFVKEADEDLLDIVTR